MTINDVAYAMAKDKEDTEEIRNLEKKIKSWENMKSYPELEDMYQLGYVIELNPGELLVLRNRSRKQFYKESGDPKVRKHDWIEISDNFSIYGSGFMKLFGIVCASIFLVWVARFIDVFYGDSAVQIEQEVIDRQIREHTEENYVPINDGTVQNFLNRKQKEQYEKHIENIKQSTGYYEDHPDEVQNIVNNISQ